MRTNTTPSHPGASAFLALASYCGCLLPIVGLLIIALLLSGCYSAEERLAFANAANSTATARVVHATSTQQAWSASRTETAQANDIAIIKGNLAETQVAREVQATQDAKDAIEATAQANERSTQEAKNAQATAAEAQRLRSTEQAAAQSTERAWQQQVWAATSTAQVLQATLTAQATIDHVALQRQFASDTATATAQVSLDAYAAGIRKDEEEQRKLALDRQRAWNWLLGAAPYLVTTPTLALLLFLAWRFGIVESNRRKLQPTGEIIDERNGQLTVLIPDKSYWPVLGSNAQGAVTQPAPVEAQSAYLAQAQIVQAVQALAAAVNPHPAARQMLDRLTAPADAAPAPAQLASANIRILTPGQDNVVDAWVEELETKHLTEESGQ